MTLSVQNLQKPSNKKWKKIADYLLYTMPLYSTAVAGLSGNLWSEKTALIITVVINVVVISIKGLTKFTAEDAPQPEETEKP